MAKESSRESSKKWVADLNEVVKPVDAKLLTETETERDGKRKKKKLYLKGVCIQGEVRNHNQRIYSREQISRAVESLKERLREGPVLGELDHPEGMTVNLRYISHAIEDIHMEGNDGVGKLRILKTDFGKVCKDLIEEGIRLGVSSRGSGYVDDDGYVEDFEILTIDVVATPSAPNAYPMPIYEMLQNGMYPRGRHLLDVANGMGLEPNPHKYERHYEKELKGLINYLGGN